MKKESMCIGMVLILAILVLFSCKDNENEYIAPPTGEVDPPGKMDWWRDAGFGMFIHYGVYAALQGEYMGKTVSGESIHFQTKGNKNSSGVTIGAGAGAEWIMYEANIPREDYREYAALFTAERYDPQSIVELAKRAGMKYIVMTTKHHDGFCLWDSKSTDWNVSMTPAGKKWNNDLIAPLAQAAREAGLKFGIYFSHARDWMHEGALGVIPELNRNTYSFTENQQYMKQYTYPMITELLNWYKPDIVWWDSPGVNPYEEFASQCFSLVDRFNPAILQNDRNTTLSAYPGDYTTPEQSISEMEVDENTEVCMTLNSSWGYSAYDDNWKRAEAILFNLLRINKLGGNYLLNIGPRADGSIPEGSVEVLEEIGAWVSDNAAALHGTRPSPFQYNLPYGPSTWNEQSGVKHLYYHVFYWDGSGELWIPGVMNPAEEVRVSVPSAPQISCTVESVQGVGLRVSGLPHEAPTDLCTTLDIQFIAEPDLDEGIREINGSIYLDALGGKVIGGEFVEWDTKPCYNWYSGRNINYKMVVTRGGNYQVSVNLAGYYSGTITFDFSDGSVLQGRNTVTPSGYHTFEWQDMGSVYLEPGVYTFDVSSQQSDSWLKLRGIRFVHQ